MSGRGEIQRFTYAERILHWVVGLSFVFLLLTGLAFSHPRLFWITSLVGGGSTARVLHPWMGVIFFGSLVAMVLVWARDMRIDSGDREWLKAIRHYAVHDKDGWDMTALSFSLAAAAPDLYEAASAELAYNRSRGFNQNKSVTRNLRAAVDKARALAEMVQ